ncbi:YihY/virulence factor BrkB family protein [Frankia sp. AgPm24]|uniref:YihY/virulence factor BrkB family protein n=1 Tax=Frankia umida TaxID=573489 RepID=A0ABT0K3G0_9ACTN|nr:MULTISPECIES: YihY/virulence factor BrkB family protein [Frankia]MCK9878037.1 YihY/virulence factor BrkB family protein [Frankia umida]MCK9925114.1 YihY/virulence factor BrkB family protein [Frankia sp. AgPm24]
MEGALTRVVCQVAALRRDVVDGLRGHDLALIAAGVTYYAAIAIVPGVLVAISLIDLLLGEARTREFGRSLAEALPGGLGAPAVVHTAFQAAATMSPLVVAGAAVPATFYGEGLRRAFVRLAGQRENLVGWRGRLSVLPLLAAAPVLLLPVLLVTPILARLFADSGLSAALGVVVAFTVDWLVLTVTLTFVYRVVGPGRPAWTATLCAAGATGSFVAGFVQGFVLFLSFTLDLGLPFGGFSAVGAAVAVGFWLFLIHLIVLVGYGLTLRLSENRGASVCPAPTHRGLRRSR